MEELSNREAFLRRMDAQLSICEKEFQSLVESLDEVDRQKYYTQIEELREKLDKSCGTMPAVRTAGDDVWTDMVRGAERAVKDFNNAFNRFITAIGRRTGGEKG